MELTRDVSHTINARISREPEFAQALVIEAESLLGSGEPDTARLILRDILTSTMGLDKLTDRAEISSEKARAVLSGSEVPTIEDMTTMLKALGQILSTGTNVIHCA